MKTKITNIRRKAFGSTLVAFHDDSGRVFHSTYTPMYTQMTSIVRTLNIEVRRNIDDLMFHVKTEENHENEDYGHSK
jgi:hypothetical protein